MNAFAAWAAAEARRMHDEHVAEEERRMAERRTRPGNGGRRVGEAEHVPMVAPEPTYRVVNGRCQGMVAPESDTVECPREYLFGCDGTGKRLHWIRDDEAVEVECPVCCGVGRILGVPDAGGEVQRLALVEGSPAGQPEGSL